MHSIEDGSYDFVVSKCRVIRIKGFSPFLRLDLSLSEDTEDYPIWLPCNSIVTLYNIYCALGQKELCDARFKKGNWDCAELIGCTGKATVMNGTLSVMMPDQTPEDVEWMRSL